jgi:hypothetical protein
MSAEKSAELLMIPGCLLLLPEQEILFIAFVRRNLPEHEVTAVVGWHDQW